MDESICQKNGSDKTAKKTEENLAHPIHLSSLVNENVRSSLQSCSLQDNRTKLEGLLSVMANKNSQKGNVIHGLLFVLNQLLVSNNVGKAIGYLEFDTAYDMYCGFFDVPPKAVTFRDNLLHSQHGLCVLIVTLAQKKR